MSARKLVFFLFIILFVSGLDVLAQKPVKREKVRTGQNDVIKDGDQNWGVKQGKRKGAKVTKRGRKYTNSKEAGKSTKTNQTRYTKPSKRTSKKRFHSKKAKEDKEKFEKEINTASKDMKKEDKARRKRGKEVQKENRKTPQTQKIPRRMKKR